MGRRTSIVRHRCQAKGEKKKKKKKKKKSTEVAPDLLHEVDADAASSQAAAHVPAGEA